MPPQLTLYRANKACSLVPHVLLRELKIPFTSVLMEIGPEGVQAADGSITRDQYREINPNGLVPALRVDNDTILTENPAILTYIASLAPERQVFGRTDLERAQVYQWICWLSGTLHGKAYLSILRPARFADDPGAQAEIVAKGRKAIANCYERIESSLDGEHAVGDVFTIADVYVYIFWEWGYRNSFDMAKHYPRYGRLARKVEQMESVREAIEVEGLPLQFP